MGLVAPWHVGSSWIRDRTRVPCIGRRILNHCTTREVPVCFLRVMDMFIILIAVMIIQEWEDRHTFLFTHFLKYIYLFIFLAALGLGCCAWAFSSCGEWGLLFLVMISQVWMSKLFKWYFTYSVYCIINELYLRLSENGIRTTWNSLDSSWGDIGFWRNCH